MALRYKVLFSVLAAGSTLAAHQALVAAKAVAWLSWPAFLLRIPLLLAMAPVMALSGWLELRGLPSPPMMVGLSVAFLGYLHMACQLRTALRAKEQIPRRRLLFGAGSLAAAGCGAASCYPTPEVTRRELRLQDLPRSLHGTRVVLLSDLHRGPVIGKDYLDQVIAHVNSLGPDLVLMPGDFITYTSRYLSDVTDVLSRLRPSIASVASLGNHDNWEGSDLVEQALTQAGVLVLTNRSVVLGTDRTIVSRAERGLCLAGVDDLGSGKPDLGQALEGVSPRIPRLLLSHNPDLAENPEALSAGHRVDLQLSGHTHGGQVVLPGVGPLVTGSRHGLKYLAGWVEGPRWPVYVTRGIGTSVVPVRIGSTPEIVVFDLGRRLP